MASLKSFVRQFENDANRVSEWASADENTSVDMGGGPVRSPAKLIKDNDIRINETGLLAQVNDAAARAEQSAADAGKLGNIESGDPIEAEPEFSDVLSVVNDIPGSTDPINLQALALANRTEYLNKFFGNVISFGAIEGGLIDSTESIDSAIESRGCAYFPYGVYLYNGNVDRLFSLDISGPGSIRYKGFDYPAMRGRASNILWPGEFKNWQMGHSLNVESTQRTVIPCRVSHARDSFSSGTNVSHVRGYSGVDSLRVQRIQGNSSEDSHYVVINLTAEESESCIGDCVIQLNAFKSPSYNGGPITIKGQFSVEPEQPILSSNGDYTSGSETLFSEEIDLETNLRPASTPYFYKFTVPEYANQVAISINIPFSGVAGADDSVVFERITIHSGISPAFVEKDIGSSLDESSAMQYQSSYPYAAPRGTNTEQGSVSAIAINSTITRAISIPIRFTTRMWPVPQFIFQSPNSGTESRFLNKDTGATLNGLASNISGSGVTISNNAAAVAGNLYLCQWTAQSIF